MGHWTELDLTTHFRSFTNEIYPLVQSLPQLLHHRTKVVDRLLHYLVLPDCTAVVALLDLITHMARDLREEFWPFFPLVRSLKPGSIAAALATPLPPPCCCRRGGCRCCGCGCRCPAAPPVGCGCWFLSRGSCSPLRIASHSSASSHSHSSPSRISLMVIWCDTAFHRLSPPFTVVLLLRSQAVRAITTVLESGLGMGSPTYEAEVFGAAFRCLAFLFKYLLKQLMADPTELLTLYGKPHAFPLPAMLLPTQQEGGKDEAGESKDEG